MEQAQPPAPPKRYIPIKPFLFLAFVLVCFVLINLPPVKRNISLEAINAHLAYLTELANRPYGPFLFMLAMLIVLLVQIPGASMVVLAGLVYNLAEAFIYSMIAGLAGVTVTFLFARYFLQDYLRPRLKKSLIGPHMKRLEKNGLFTVAFLRLLFFMSPIVNWSLGATKLRVREYVLGSALGMIPITLAHLIVVKKLKSMNSIRDLLQPEIIGIAALFIAMIVGIALLRKRMVKADAQNS